MTVPNELDRFHLLMDTLNRLYNAAEDVHYANDSK